MLAWKNGHKKNYQMKCGKYLLVPKKFYKVGTLDYDQEIAPSILYKMYGHKVSQQVERAKQNTNYTEDLLILTGECMECSRLCHRVLLVGTLNGFRYK